LGSVFCVEPNASHWAMCGDTLGSICIYVYIYIYIYIHIYIIFWRSGAQCASLRHKYDGGQCVSLEHIYTHTHWNTSIHIYISECVSTHIWSPMCLIGTHRHTHCSMGLHTKREPNVSPHKERAQWVSLGSICPAFPQKSPALPQKKHTFLHNCFGSKVNSASHISSELHFRKRTINFCKRVPQRKLHFCKRAIYL